MMDYSRYPENWDAISLAIRLRDGGKCKFCGVPNGLVVVRHYGIPRDWSPPDWLKFADPDALRRMAEGMVWITTPYTGEPGEGTKIVLTVAHLGAPREDGPGSPHDKMDVRDCNLAALCQRCHLMLDLDDHVLHAAETRRRRRVEAGQIELFGSVVQR